MSSHSSQSKNRGESASHAVPVQSPSDRELRLCEALVMWLRWNDAHERITQRLYAEQSDPVRSEELLDQLDHLRRDAIRLSQELLD